MTSRGVAIFYGLAVIQTPDHFCTLGHFLVWVRWIFKSAMNIRSSPSTHM